jgi:AcrR family transcriptional regulator
MAVGTRTQKPERKATNAYHHGNLRQALVDEAVRTIRRDGVEALTLRSVGERLRVSRTALYRHFSDKTALLAAVANDGFREFRQALNSAWDDGGHGLDGFATMGRAYVAFALANPSHYRVMFGGFVDKIECDPGLAAEAGAAFQVLLGAITELQQQKTVRPGDPMLIARFAWATVHGVAMLGIDGQLQGSSAEELATFAADRVRAAIAA